MRASTGKKWIEVHVFREQHSPKPFNFFALTHWIKYDVTLGKDHWCIAKLLEYLCGSLAQMDDTSPGRVLVSDVAVKVAFKSCRQSSQWDLE